MARFTAHDFQGPRLALALVFGYARLTQYEVAKALGKPSGSVHGLLRRMVADGLVLADSDPPTRGTLYELNPEARAALEEAAEGVQTPGLLERHQRLLHVRGDQGRREIMRLLDSTALSGAVGWVAQTNVANELLIAMNPAADDDLVDTLVYAFEDAGFECREGLVSSVMSASELREHNRTASARAKEAR
jgi:DNA-binding MarR family transcriptional regulator